MARLKLGIGSVFLPLFGLTAASQRLAGNAAETVIPRGELLRQNEALRRENLEFRTRLANTEKLAAEMSACASSSHGSSKKSGS